MTELQTERRRLEGIARYAEANNSDPFALARCMTHYRMGLCGPCEPSEMHWLFTEDVHDKNGKVIAKHNTGAVIGGDVGSEGGYDAMRYGAGQWGSIART
jgi:hypothetical protein